MSSLSVCFGTRIHTHVARTFVVCEASGFGRGVVETVALLRCYAAYVGTAYRRFGTVCWSSIQESSSHKRGDLQSISPISRYRTFMLVLSAEPFVRPQIVLYLTENTFCLSDEDQSCTGVTNVCVSSFKVPMSVSVHMVTAIGACSTTWLKVPNVQFHKSSSAGSSRGI
jgi:hypothetical protein